MALLFWGAAILVVGSHVLARRLGAWERLRRPGPGWPETRWQAPPMMNERPWLPSPDLQPPWWAVTDDEQRLIERWARRPRRSLRSWLRRQGRWALLAKLRR